MRDSSPQFADTPTRVHPTVALDYRVRITLYPLYLLLYSTHVWSRGVSAWVWALFIWELLIWPHVAMLIARRSADSKRAELRNLLIDSFVIGFAVPLTGYSLWPNAAGLLGVSAGNMAIGGVRFTAKGALSTLAGVAAAGLVVGFHPDLLGASLLTQLLSLAVVFTYLIVFARATFVQSQNVMRSNRMIRAQSAQLEEEGAMREQRSADLERAVTEAEAANTAKSNFLANMSHELRTPLNSIIGFANILLRNREGNLRAQDVTYLTRITANGSHLLTLINGVLDLSKIDARQMHLDLASVDVADLVRETLSEMEPQAEARQVELVADVPELALMTADRARLKQIMLNLVGNAVKFTHNGRVVLRVARDEASLAPTRIDVIDTGVGIAADRLGAVFEAFQQEDSTTARQYGGTGLGLTITRSLARLMGWDVTAASQLGVGSTFSVIMTPASEVSEVAAVVTPPSAEEVLPDQVSPAVSGAPVRVLVIDDESDARTILRNQLEELGCEVVTAASADEGIALGRRVKPDLITLDIMMPRKSGWDALRELKAIPELREVPVVVVSLVARDRRGRLFGAVDFVDKPVTRDALIDVITRNVRDANRPRVLLVHDRHANVHRYRELALADDVTLEAVATTDAASDAVQSSSREHDMVVIDVVRWNDEMASWIAELRARPGASPVRVVLVVSDLLPAAAAERLVEGAVLLPRDAHLAAGFGALVHEMRARGSAIAPA